MKPRALRRMIRQALREDVGREDITTRLTVEPEARCAASVIAKSDGVLSGVMPFWMVFDDLRAEVDIDRHMTDGDVFSAGDVLATFTALAQPTLTGERTALNFLQHLSGVASATRRFVDAVGGIDVRITDTRKTTPLFRKLEKDAVVHGGGHNHRTALYDGILIKDNHIQACGGIATAVARARSGTHHLMRIEVEVTNLDECREALDAGADVIMLDNMELDAMREAIAMGRERRPGVLFEASGNVTLENVGDIAETGVDVISTGSITHSARAADISLDFTIQSESL
jgi:nicotinate-nucleotide pyrophosphorylase (carboxylating)